jgi:hypothetical protein
MHAIVAVNDSLVAVQGHACIKDIDTDQVLLNVDFQVPANGAVVVGSLPSSSKQAMWLIEWTINNMPMRSHFLSGARPFHLNDYRRWLAKLAIPSDVGPAH